MEYNIVENTSSDALVEDVNELNKDGWEPIGGVSVVHHEWENSRKGYTEDEFIFYQAVVKRAAETAERADSNQLPHGER